MCLGGLKGFFDTCIQRFRKAENIGKWLQIAWRNDVLDVSPLLDQSVISDLKNRLETHTLVDHEQFFSQYSVEESIHMLRFIISRGYVSENARSEIDRIWRLLLTPNYPIDTEAYRRALFLLSQGWTPSLRAYNSQEPTMDEHEQLLDTLGQTDVGIDYFKWLAMHPMTLMDGVRDDVRRGAIISLAKYAYHRSNGSCEMFMARHLDDWIIIQAEIVSILGIFRSRLLERLSVWYLKHDDTLRPILLDYFYDPSS